MARLFEALYNGGCGSEVVHKPDYIQPSSRMVLSRNMAQKIQILSGLTIDQIAAGEVIEQPASVVKELIENALDAGATRIEVETRGGGLQLIRVADNGCGMGREDLLLSIERHATSKLRAFDDLETLSTMGFRGEALASIAAISRFSIESAEEGGEGTLLQLEGGAHLSVRPSMRQRGTTIEVHSLFYNVPARRKFQKSAAHCGAEITRAVTALALAFPKVGFRLVQQEKEILHLQPLPKAAPLEALLTRLPDLLGEEFSRLALPVDWQEGGVRCLGVVVQPEATRPSRTGQHLVLNRRPVVAPGLQHAVKQAFGTRIDPQRYPQFMLHFELPLRLVDLNVHPQKKEVRLRDEQAARSLLMCAVREALEKSEGRIRYREPILAREESQLPSYSWIAREESSPSSLPPVQLPIEGLLKEKEEPLDRPLALFRSYLLVERSGKLFALHLRRAAQRICYERLLGSEESPEVQGLLLPQPFSFSLNETQQLEPLLPQLASMGLLLRPFGPKTLLLEALPKEIEPCQVQSMLARILEESLSPKEQSPFRERIARRLSAHAGSINYSLPQAIEILRQLSCCRESTISPFQTAIWIEIDGLSE